MRLKTYNTLDWNNANTRQFKYIYYLAQMVYERSIKVGISINTNRNISYAGNQCSNVAFDILQYQPAGFFRFKHIQMIYHMMLYLGIYVYMNPDNLSESNWKNGDNRQLFGYSLKDMCNIANFDFFANPLLPNQPLNYYDKFLKPIHDVLASYRYYWTNLFVGLNKNKLYTWGYPAELPTKVIDGRTYTYNGPDKINYEGNFDNLKNKAESEGEQTDENTTQTHILGAQIFFYYDQFYWNGYKGDQSWSKYEGICWSGFYYRYENNVKPIQNLCTGCPYTLYLYHSTFHVLARHIYSSRDWDNRRLAYFQSPFNMLISLQSGTINNQFPTFHIHLPTKWAFNTNTSNIPIEEFWKRRYYSRTNYTDNTNARTLDGKLGFYYRPLIKVDYISKFNLF